jgi:glucose/arabinose dehydrogenase
MLRKQRIYLLDAMALLLSVAARAATLPAGFTETFLTSTLASPTAMALAGDGRIFVCEQDGKLRVIKNSSLLATPFLTVNVDSSGERGLLGVALDPNFTQNQYVYIYYTVPSPAHNRLSRFTANGDVAVPGSEVILLELNNLSSATNHNGGALHFGADGKLYIASGNNANNANSQTLMNLLGKILRLNSDGSVPPDNPFFNMPPDRPEIWTFGLRNPFTFGIQPGTGLIFIDDVGENTWEEINVGVAGANYGWALCEGPFVTNTTTLCSSSHPSFGEPFFWYQHINGQCAITAGDFYDPQVAGFPAGYVGKYFFADFCAGWIQYVDPAAASVPPTPPPVTSFATGLSSPVDIIGGYDGNLYYLQRGGGSSTGAVSKITYTGSNAPAITQDPLSQTISVGHSVTFNVAASGAPTLTYQWQRDHVNISGQTSPSYTISSVSIGDDGHLFRCMVSNSFGTATSADATLSVTSDQPPVPTITIPASGTTYAAGDTINFAGTATDPDGPPPPASAFTWWVNFHHDTHFHPFLPPTSGITSGSFVVPVIGETSPNVWYRIHLSVTDGTLTTETFVDVLPRLSMMTFATSPTGLQLTLDGLPFTAPMTVTGVVNMTRTIGAPSPQGSNIFQSWSDGGAQTHDISTPASNTTYTATFTGGASPTPTRTFTRTPTSVPTFTPTPTPLPPTATPTRTPTPPPTPTPTPTPTQLPQPVVSSITPTSGAAAGGTSVSIIGTNFFVVSTVSVGGQPASSTYVNPTHLNAVAPSLPAGTLNTVKVANGQSSGSLVNGWMADFSDVPGSNPYHADIEKVFRAGVTVGCNPGNYCPQQGVLRSEMAVFLLKSEHGSTYVPPSCAGIFADVPCPGTPIFPYSDWIERLSQEGVTSGCYVNPLRYCPDRTVSRAEMAALLLKTEHGAAYQPPACAGAFADVPCPSTPSFPFSDWIERLLAEGITAGCAPPGPPSGLPSYCPDAVTPREQMATFLVRTFGLP